VRNGANRLRTGGLGLTFAATGLAAGLWFL